MPNKSARSSTPQAEVFSSCDVLSQVMGVLMKELHLCNSGGASPSTPSSLGLLTWWLQLQLTSKTMRGVLRQLPLSINFSNHRRKAPLYEDTPSDELAWELLLRCTIPIDTLRCACLLLKCWTVYVLCIGLQVMLTGSSRCCGVPVRDSA